VRSASSLERLTDSKTVPPSNAGLVLPLPTGSAGDVKIPEPGRFNQGEWLLDAGGQPLRLASPDSVVAVYKDPSTKGGPILVSRVATGDGRILWTAKLERQRGLRAARQLDDQLVLVTAGAARDFAVALDVANGKTRWVYFF
jgi:hypothetical protein